MTKAKAMKLNGMSRRVQFPVLDRGVPQEATMMGIELPCRRKPAARYAETIRAPGRQGGLRSTFCRLLALGLFLLAGCDIQIVPPIDGNGSDPGGDPPDDAAVTLRVAFDARRGNFATAVDDDGAEYSFRARSENGRTVLTEVNVLGVDGLLVKASLDSLGRPVNFRSSDNSAADLVYEGNTVRVRVTNAQGEVVADEAELDPTAARVQTISRRYAKAQRTALRTAAVAASPSSATQQNSATSAFPTSAVDKVNSTAGQGSGDVFSLTVGLESYEEISLSLFDETLNPHSPLLRVSFVESALRIADIVSVVEIIVATRAELSVAIDETPSIIRRLAGRTFVLFDAEGYCANLNEVANHLTFDEDGVLISEFDRHIVFPDFGLGGSADAGVTINYLTGTPINLTPEGDLGFTLFMTPVFTGTQVDASQRITIERRFEAEVTFDVSVIDIGFASTSQLFDAALVNGELDPTGNVLEFDLALVNLFDQVSATSVGRLRYRDQASPLPARRFDCQVAEVEKIASTIACPGSVAVGELYDIEIFLSRDDQNRSLLFDWFVSDGYAFILGDPTDPQTQVLATAPGFIEMTLVVTDLSAGGDFEVYGCETRVGGAGLANDLIIECPTALNAGEPGVFSVGGGDALLLDDAEWFVFGTGDFLITNPWDLTTVIQVYQPGRYDVAFRGFQVDTAEIFVTCEVIIGGILSDECELNGFYGDGICDEFCPRIDSDCADFIDPCDRNGFYGDGVCDVFCFDPDPDCETAIDFCEVNGLYGDGACDLFCLLPDPDCDLFDVCRENNWYDDGVCDLVCEFPDPDCEGRGGDLCALRGYYGDGVCDEFCLSIDPDCHNVDVCADNGFYDDGQCDNFCPFPDPDCDEFDECLQNRRYGDGVCDSCPLPDPDCNEVDICEVNGFYGDGVCDEFCPLPDPDC